MIRWQAGEVLLDMASDEDRHAAALEAEGQARSLYDDLAERSDGDLAD